MSLELHLARLAYEAYSIRTAGRPLTGDSLPPFHDLPEDIRDAWVAAADAVKTEVITPRQPFHLTELD
jgi:hypothetical protein